MRKIFIGMLAALVALAACNQMQEFPTPSGEGVTKISLGVPDKMSSVVKNDSSTKSTSPDYVNSALSGIVNLPNAELEWDVKIYYGLDEDADLQTVEPIYDWNTDNGYSSNNPADPSNTAAKIQATAVDKKFDASVELAKGKKYLLVATAKLSDSQVAVTGSSQELFNDESEDYYTVKKAFIASGVLEASLIRPVGKLRLVATDYAKAITLMPGKSLQKVEVVYKDITDPAQPLVSSAKTYFEGVDAVGTGSRTIFVDYLPALAGEESYYPFTVKMTFATDENLANAEAFEVKVVENIPIKANCLTTVKGEIFTTQNKLTIDIEDNLSGGGEISIDPANPPANATDLSNGGTANSYIVSAAGAYKFKAVKGNSPESVGTIASVVALWETFGTATKPDDGELVSGAKYEVDGADVYITFNASDKKGNALIAAKDASDNILWSWHIWMTDKPADVTYTAVSATMMDRNLGATSAAPGAVEALGLFYQWGRKDPFLGSSKIQYTGIELSERVASTLTTWPDAVVTSSEYGTIEYAQAHPTTLICREDLDNNRNTNNDWYYTGGKTKEGERWGSTKTKYDPCPPGYKVPDSSVYSGINSYRKGGTITDKNVNFDTNAFDISTVLTGSTEPTGIWYQLAGNYFGLEEQIGVYDVNRFGYYWTSTYDSSNNIHEFLAFMLRNEEIIIQNTTALSPGDGASVRCCKE